MSRPQRRSWRWQGSTATRGACAGPASWSDHPGGLRPAAGLSFLPAQDRPPGCRQSCFCQLRLFDSLRLSLSVSPFGGSSFHKFSRLRRDRRLCKVGQRPTWERYGLSSMRSASTSSIPASKMKSSLSARNSSMNICARAGYYWQSVKSSNGAISTRA